jgi:hypothetical protein
MSSVDLSPAEHQLISEAVQTGNLNPYTNYFMALPNSGSMWMPDDAIGHYRHLFTYEFLFDAWSQTGKQDEFDVVWISEVAWHPKETFQNSLLKSFTGL